ncbi:MAG: DUF192 domain-containing protein [Patescibacteria group bacterium]
MKPKLLLAVILSAGAMFVLAAIFKTGKENEAGIIRLEINNVGLEAELADTAEKRTAGLSGREKLPENQGMLFIFDAPAYYHFWMKNMKFPIDIIWINKDKKIADIVRNAAPESYPEIFKPSQAAQYVLEVNAGFTEQHQIKIGETVDFQHNLVLK